MSLREHERRILEEIERQLREEEPDLAEQLESFGAGGPDTPADPGLSSWKPWIVCTLIAAVTTGLLILLFVLTPSTPQPPSPEVGEESSESTEQAPDGEPVGGQTPVAPGP